MIFTSEYIGYIPESQEAVSLTLNWKPDELRSQSSWANIESISDRCFQKDTFEKRTGEPSFDFREQGR